MNVLSLFDGMSCGQLALQHVGISYNNYFASEIDKWAIQITQKNFPDTIQLGDINNWQEWNLPEIDLLMGGSPCQGFSNSGLGLNFSDPRSELFFKYVSCLKLYKPTYFLLENVQMKRKWQNIITSYLNVEPIKINSALVSAQNRKRLYWTNIPNVIQPQDKNILLKDIIENGEVDRNKSYCIDANYFKGGSLKMYLEKSRRQIVYLHSHQSGEIDWRKLTPLECERLQTVPDNYTKSVSNTQRYKMLGNAWTVDIIAHILSFIKGEL